MSRTFKAALCMALAAIGVSAFGAADTSKYGFEKSTQGWAVDATVGAVSVSTAQHFAGASSLAIKVSGPKVNRVSTLRPPVKPGSTVTFHVWVPATGVTVVQPFVQDKAYKWIGGWTAMRQLKGNVWNTIKVKIPANAKSPLWKIGIEVTGDGKSSPTVYVNSVN